MQMNLLLRNIRVTILAVALTTGCQAQKQLEPDSFFEQLTLCGDTLCLQADYRGGRLLDPSPLLLYMEDGLIGWSVDGQETHLRTDTVRMRTGERDIYTVRCTETVYRLQGRTEIGMRISARLLTRRFDNLLAYRFILDLPDTLCRLRERSEFRLATDGLRFCLPNGEHEPVGPLSMEKLPVGRYTTPVIAYSNKLSLSIHEADLHDYPALQLGFAPTRRAVVCTVPDAMLQGETALPWRVVAVSKDLAGLHNGKHLYQSLNEPPQGDFSWVRPGISLWDWRVKGCTFAGFTYGMDTRSLKHYVDFAARNGIPYFLLDDEWYMKENPLQPVEGLDIREVMDYAREQDVGIFLYYDQAYVGRGSKALDFDLVARTYASWGAKGIKYGFLGGKGSKYSPQEKTRKTEELICTAARHRLMILFHDSPVPYSGLDRTYPNYINREYCHAQLDRRIAFPPCEFVKIACVNLLAGPIDQTNGTFALNEMKSRAKGPRNEYPSTVASETARFFITHTGHFSVLLDAPEAYSAKADLFEFICSLPDRWDEARYLDMDFESHVCVTRRSGQRWFVGTVYNEAGGTHHLELNFLPPGTSYQLTLYRDADDTHYLTRKETYQVESFRVKGGDTVIVSVAPGGGYAAVLEPVQD